MMINTGKMRLLPYYQMPKDWIVHVIDRSTNEQQLEFFKKTIENAQLMAFDTETMPSFYQNHHRTLAGTKPSLLQVALRSSDHQTKNVFLIDLQELFDQSSLDYRPCSISTPISHLLTDLFNHSNAKKLSHSLFYDLAQLKCGYDEKCFQTSKLEHIIELSKLFRHVYSNEKFQEIYSLQRMTSMIFNRQLNKKQQCANWSKRPLTQLLKDYAAIDVIVMIDIYDRLSENFQQDILIDTSSSLSWSTFQHSIETSIDLAELILHSCLCHRRFLTSKTRNKHARTCSEYLSQNPEKFDHSMDQSSSSLAPIGRGYLPPALKCAYQNSNPDHFHEKVRSSVAYDRWNRYNENRPPDAQYFLQDDDKEVAQAFGFQTNELSSSKSMPTITQIPLVSRSKSNMKVAAFPPRKPTEESQLLDRLQVDIDSQPDFHCHLFGLGGRGRSLYTDQSPPSPQLLTSSYSSSH